jgi:hypothetical protein
MFAGRYLWWAMVSIAGFLFFAVYFDYVSWAIIQGFGCERSSGSCGPLAVFLLDSAKPDGFWLAGAILFVCTIARIHYLGMNPLWDLVVAVWFLATGPFPLLFTNIWHGELQFQAIADAIPVPLLFLAAFGVYLALPFEEDDRRPFGTWQPLRYLVTVAAAHSVLLAMADNSAFPVFLSRELGLTRLAAMIVQLQPQAGFLLRFGRSDDTAAYVALSVFILCMLASILPRRWIAAGADSLPFTPTESPRRR